MKARISVRLLLILLSLNGVCAFADETSAETSNETSNTPYIDSLKQELQKKDAHNPSPTDDNPQPYIDSIKRKMDKKDESAVTPPGKLPPPPPATPDAPQPYIDQLKQQNPSLNDGNAPPSYIEQQKAKLGDDHSTGAIDAVKEGNSDLHMKRPGEINNLFSIEIGTLYKHQASTPSDVSVPGFYTVYGSGYAPDVRFEYERFLIRGEDTMSVGIMAYTAIQYFAGPGVFAATIPYPAPLPDGTVNFPSKSQTRFALVNIPLGIGPAVHFNFLRYFRPYVEVMPTGSIFFESRNDSLPGNHGRAIGFTTTAGVAIQLDWISKDATWALYRDYGIKHVSLTAEYSRLDTPLTAVDFKFSGLDLGFSFEY